MKNPRLFIIHGKKHKIFPSVMFPCVCNFEHEEKITYKLGKNHFSDFGEGTDNPAKKNTITSHITIRINNSEKPPLVEAESELLRFDCC